MVSDVGHEAHVDACAAEELSHIVIVDAVSNDATRCACDCGELAVEDSETVVMADLEAASPELVVPSEPTLADAASAPADEAAAAPPASVVPHPAPTDEVRQAVALSEPEKPDAEVVLPKEEPAAAQEPESIAPPPMEEDVLEVEPAPAVGVESVPAAEQNLFEEVDRAEAGSGIAPIVPEPAAAGEPQDVPDAAPDREPADSADPFEAARPSRREPARRWIDRSGGYAVVAALCDVRDDGTCVLETPERTIEVPVEALSRFDRSYVDAVAGRLAVFRGPSPAETAGR